MNTTSLVCRSAFLILALLVVPAAAEPPESRAGAGTDQAFAELLGTLQAKWDLFLDPRWGLRNPDTVAEGRVMLFHMLHHAVELAAGGVGATLKDTEMQLAEDGSYEIIVSAEQPESGNWLRLDPEAMSITTRHYFETEHNVGTDPRLRIDLGIERLDFPGAAPLATESSTADGLRRMTHWLQQNVFPPLPERSPDWISRTPNAFSNPGSDDSNLDINYAAADNVYRMTRWRLAPDEALVITGRLPDCRFANVVLYNDYLQTLPYRYRQVSLNRKQMLHEPDGSFRVIVAHKNPNEPNWLDTGGREEGVVFWRFLLPTEPVPALETKILPL